MELSPAPNVILAVGVAALGVVPAFADPVDPAIAAFTESRRGVLESARWHVVCDFVERFADAVVLGEPRPSATPASIGGRALPGISHHPRLHETDPPVLLRFDRVSLPEVSGDERLVLHFFLGINEGFSPEDLPEFDGCTFRVALDGSEVFQRTWTQQLWEEWAIDLTARSGGSVSVEFRVEPNANSACDWAVWGRPRILIEGRRSTPRSGPQIDMLRVDQLLSLPDPVRVVEQHEDGPVRTIVAVMDERLDLPTELRRTRQELEPALVPLAPPMVVGEGEHPDNHTVVRVLNEYGIPAAQFLAFPPVVRGGVQATAGRFRDGPRIVAAPLSASDPREIRVFSVHGARLRSFTPSDDLAAPFRVECGDYHSDLPGDEIAVFPRFVRPGSEHLAIYDGDGVERARVLVPVESEGQAALAREVVFLAAEGRAFVVDALAGEAAVVAEGLEGCTGVFPSAYGGFTAPKRDADRSLLVRAEAPNADPMDIGRYERIFWYQWYAKEPSGDGEFIRSSVYSHIRTDVASPAFACPRFGSEDPEHWTGGSLRATIEQRVTSYAAQPPQVWNACFSHRAHKGPFEPWARVRDEATGLPEYIMLTRNNTPADYGEFDSVGFHSATYALDLPDLDRLYVWPLRAFLRGLAQPFRGAPERFVALEPNHEHEIAVGAEGSNGDYNPRMIAGFFDFLVRRYGRDPSRIEAALGVRLGDYFDAPRSWDRGDWDDYAQTNPFYREWIAYNRYVVNRRLAQTFREALLAGFPPESVKSHQIPDTYAVGGLSAFSNVVNRYTPIDYALTAGVGFGFTRYGVWYTDAHNAIQGASSSGFDLVCIGEYQALTPDPDIAYAQLRYIHQNGGASVHCMWWPEGYDQGYNAAMDAALRRLVAEDPPRPGVTGGVGQVRSAQGFDVASLGVNASNTGLIKSLRADGTWEGSVYVVPFHAHVAIETIAVRPPDADGVWRTPILEGLDSGRQIEVTWRARSKADGDCVRVSIERDGVPLPGLSVGAPVTDAWSEVRFVLRVQLPIDGIGITLAPSTDAVEIRDVGAVRFAEQAVSLSRRELDGTRHRGGVTFDLLPPEG